MKCSSARARAVEGAWRILERTLRRTRSNAVIAQSRARCSSERSRASGWACPGERASGAVVHEQILVRVPTASSRRARLRLRAGRERGAARVFARDSAGGYPLVSRALPPPLGRLVTLVATRASSIAPSTCHERPCALPSTSSA